jgi:hypothetical protein
VWGQRFDAAMKRTAATGHVGQNGCLILGSPTNVLGRNAFELAINRFFSETDMNASILFY